MYIDPVCGMEVKSKQFSYEMNDHIYHFCSLGCLEKFKNSSSRYTLKKKYDLIIIGGGPAGLTAAVYASISKIDTLLVTQDIGGQAIDSSKIKNYMGFEFITGKDLTKKFKTQFLKEHFLAHKIDDVIRIESRENQFEIVTKEKKSFTSKAIIIATGMKKRKLGIPGEEKFARKGVSYSSVQDISLFKGLDVVVIGGGNSGIQTADDLDKTGCKVTLITKGEMIADPKNIDMIRKEGEIDIYEKHDVIEILGKDHVESIIIQSEETLETKQLNCMAVFIQVGFLPNTEFCKNLVKLNKSGEIIISSDCSTDTKGVFACGDVTNAFGKRIIIASGEGAKAVLSARKYLLAQK